MATSIGEELILVDHVSKKFCRHLKRSLQYGVMDMARELMGRPRDIALRRDEFWAIKDVSFSIKRGEIVGVIGPNGAGKTTLLRLINGLILPDQGRLVVRGKVGAMIQLGAGFSPILSGRENIHVNAAILGMTKEETKGKLEQIIEFADIDEFIDSPVQSYSSGMRARLGFAVAIHMNPDILLVDEVLAVGDMIFRNKALAKMHQLATSGVAVVFISHNLDQVDRLCHSAIYLQNGQFVASGPTREIITQYAEASSPDAQGAKFAHYPGTQHYLSILQVTLHDETGNPIDRVESCGILLIRVEFEAKQFLESPLFSFMFEAPGHMVIAAIVTQKKGSEHRPSFSPGRHILETKIARLSLIPGAYTLRASVYGTKEIEIWGRISRLADFTVIPYGRQNVITNENVFVELDASWSVGSTINLEPSDAFAPCAPPPK
ncbi:MAG: ABC transporter ATP-binding protein [Magnetococcales bacterium]|nr:ABC transporter ATP-binding protein [Magnetococcales bacterium]